MTINRLAFKKTGLDWMPEVPQHWEVKRLGGLFEERNETVSENDFMPLSVTMKGVVPQLESAAKTMHVDNRKKVCIGDFAINSRSDRRGSGGLSALEGSVSIVNTVLKPSAYYLPEYTHFLLTNKLFQDEYYAKGKGIVADMWSTRFSEMKTIFLPVPPKDEQDKIVQYIKAQEEKINLFIQKKLRFIELLKEQKRNIYRERIINGLNKAVAKRTTKFEWLGEIPNHWELKRLKNVSENLNYRRIPIDAAERGRMAEQKFDYYGATGVIDKVENFIFDETTILVAEDGANLKMRNIKLVYIASGKYWVNNHAHIIRTSQMDIEYLAEWLELIDYNPLITGSAQPKLWTILQNLESELS